MNCQYSSDTLLRRTSRWCKAAFLGAAFAWAGTAGAQVTVTATAGDVGPTNYATVSAAFAAVNAGTPQGAIVITVTANTTEPALATALLRSNAPSNYASILLTCTGNVTVNSAATPTTNRGIIELLGADNVTIDGDDPGTGGTRNLTIQMATNTTAGTQCIRLASNSATGTDGADNNTVRNCNIIGGRSSATSTTTSWGIMMGNTASGTGGAYSSLNTLIENNAVTRCYTGIGAIGVSATYLNAGTIIRNNVLGSATSADNIGLRGINISYSASTAGVGSATIRNNDIRVGDYGATGFSASIAGIEVGTVNAGLIIDRNNIHDINQPTTGGYGAFGIYVTGSATNAGITMSNNFIRDCKMVVYQTSKTSTFIPCGVFFTAGATLVNFDHNTISMGTQLGAGVNFSSFGMNASVSGVTFASFRNNIIQNTHVSTNAFGFNTAATGNISAGVVNNNDYYVPGGHVGFYNAANRTTLLDWQTATSKDGASINLAGPFQSATDLHVDLGNGNASFFNGTGANGTGVTVDFDGDTRGTPPDIGGDEFILLTCSGADGGTIAPATATACAGGTYNMTATGSTTGAGITNQWQVSLTPGGPYSPVVGGSGATTTTYTTGPLAVGTYYYVLTNTCSTGPVSDDSNELTLTVNPLPSASASNNGPTCVGGSVSLDGTTDIGTTYSWSGPNGFSSTLEDPTRSGLVLADGGTYTFTATAAGCPSAPATTVVSVLSAPTISSTTATPNPTCFNGNSQLSVAASAANYGVSPIAFAAQSTAGFVNGPSGDDVISASIPLPFTFNFYGAAKTAVFINTNGQVGFNYTGSTAAQQRAAQAVPNTTLPNDNISLCWADLNAGVGQIKYGTVGTTPNRIFVIDFNAVPFFSGGGVVTGQIQLFETTNIVEVHVNTVTTNTALKTLGIENAAGTLGAADASRNNLNWLVAAPEAWRFDPTAGLTYSWSPATFLSSTTIANPLATSVNAASTAYTVTVTGGGCPSTGIVTLTTTAPISSATLTPATPAFCAGGSVVLTATPDNGAGPFTYQWTGPSGPAGTNATQTATVGGTWSVLVSDACGGSVNPSTSVTVNPLPTPVISPSGPVSFCDSGMLTSSIATGNVWSPGAANTQSINVTASGSYSVTVTDGNGCIGTSAPVAVTVTATPTGVTANASDLLVCAGDQVDLTSTPAAPPATVLTEDFNGAAAGWSTVNNSTGGTPANAAWTLRPNGYVYSAVTYNSNDASQFYMSNSDAQGSGSVLATQLISPAFSLANYSAASLSFWHYYRDIADTGDSAVVEVSTNGGATWAIAQPYTATAGSASGFVNATVNLNAYAGQSSVTLRFRYRATWDWYWALDNVSVTGTPIPYTYSWASTPSGFSSSIQNPTGVTVNANTMYTVTVSNGICGAPASVTVNLDNTDTDSDGIIDCLDNCPSLPGQIGDICDANPGPGFLFGQISGSCTCDPVPCTENVTVDLRTDANSNEAGWEILLQSSAQVVCKGGFPDTPYPSNITNPITDNCCLPVGCYRLRVLDSAGDGFTSGGFTGGYQLRESGVNGRRIIDNFENFATGSVSAMSNTYENGAFCVPLGNIGLIYSSCDKLDWVNNKYMVCHADAGVTARWQLNQPNSAQDNNSGYNFWIFDPNGTYSFRRFRTHSTSDGFSPASATRAAHLKVNGWNNTALTPHIPADVLMNVRVRPVVQWSFGAWGPACRFKIDPARAACPLVNLQDDPANTSDWSCGVNRTFGGSNSSANKIVADPPQFQPAPLAGGTGLRYQFRFRIEAEGVCIVRPPQTSPTLYLNWPVSSGPQLQASKTYEVEVRVSKDLGATWCVDAPSPACDPSPVTSWGKACNVTISNVVMIDGGSSSIATQGNGNFTMYPNPNRGDQLFINLTNVGADVNTASVDIYDLTGKRVSARTIAVQDGIVNTTLQLNGDLAGGVYLVNITAGTKAITERLVIQP